ncbi:hypothetical protein ACFRLW_23850 [Streptomyces sp. NPDC056728]
MSTLTLGAPRSPMPAPQIAEVFGFARALMHQAAVELWPRADIRLASHVPSIAVGAELGDTRGNDGPDRSSLRAHTRMGPYGLRVPTGQGRFGEYSTHELPAELDAYDPYLV